MSKDLLSKGILLRIIYLDQNDVRKFTYLFGGEWLNKFKIKKEKFKKNEIYDIFFLKSFDIKKIKILCLEYPYLPKNFNLDKFLNENISIIDYEKNYDENIKSIIENLVEEYKQHKNFFYKYIKDINSLTSEEFHDLLILRFYPKYKHNHNKLLEEFENDVNEKYFTLSSENANNKNNFNIPSDIYALRNLFGISKKNETTTDKIFLDALKRRWIHLMIDHKKEMFKELKNTDVSFLAETEKQSFYKELEEYENSIFLEISNLEKFKTPIEVVSYWEPHLQPKPHFVYVG